ncbi:MAG: hypothetical protein M0036_26085 [Desulfobacteraceae bacterium]|nr:hypothetical protein [Desulfobacteraceae bacterium]
MNKPPLKESETVELKKGLAELKQGLVSKDRVEIRNPGRHYGNLTIDDLRKGNVSQRRNPLIADLFRRIQMVEAWGQGIPLILKHAPDVTFRETGNLFIAAFNRPSFLEQPEEGTTRTEPPASHKMIQEKDLSSTETTKKPQRTDSYRPSGSALHHHQKLGCSNRNQCL